MQRGTGIMDFIILLVIVLGLSLILSIIVFKYRWLDYTYTEVFPMQYWIKEHDKLIEEFRRREQYEFKKRNRRRCFQASLLGVPRKRPRRWQAVPILRRPR